MKICSKCKIEKEDICFGKNKDKLRGDCRQCRSLYQQINKKQIKEYKDKYSSLEENKLHKKEYDKIYRNIPEIKEKNKQYHKKYYETHFKDSIDAYNKRRDIKHIFSIYKCNARNRNLSFDLTFEQFKTFWNQNCSYCNTNIKTIGIDRVDSSIGYSLENCVSCCFTCNRMKMADSKEDFLIQIEKIYKYTIKRELK